MDSLHKIMGMLEKDLFIEIEKTKQQNIIQTTGIILTILLSLFLLFLATKVTNSIKDTMKNISNIFEKMGKITGSTQEINLETDKGQQEAFIVIEQSVIAIEEAKEKAIKANDTKSMFLANMSHEIRTPLNGIVGFTELLTHTELSEEQLEFVDTIERSSENLLSIINDILDLSKVENDKIEIEEILFNPIAHFEEASELYGAKTAEKNIDLSFFISPELANKNLKGDPTRLKEVVINLMSNALKFTPKNGKIEVNILKVGEEKNKKQKISFEVKDSGIGIPKEKMEHIFTAFSQADTSTTRKYGGTGLGLTISSKFIELMGGKIEVASVVNKGTKFYFTLEFEIEDNHDAVIENFFKPQKIVFVHSKKDKKQNLILKKYLEYTGLKINNVNNITQLEENLIAKDTKAIVVDYDFLLELSPEEKARYSQYKDLPFFLVIKPTLRKTENIFKNMDNVKYVFEPINLTKIHKVFSSIPELEVIHQEVVQKEQVKKGTVSKPKTDAQISTTFKGKVLVAEDNLINQKLFLKTLQKLHLEVDLAEDGEKATQARKKNNDYDIIFMDINMPIMTGVEATQEIIEYEKEANLPHIPIIAATANALKGDRERFIEQGMDEYITKPLKRESIISIMKKFFGEDEFDNFMIKKEEEKNAK